MKTLAALLLSLAATGFILAAPETDLRLTSTDLASAGTFPQRFTCDGVNDSPNLRFDGIPEATKSLAVIMEDLDAPGGTFTHWLAWNIPPDTKEFSTGSVPGGVVQGMNDFKKSGYGGPCPPSGVHRYVLHLYALDTMLQLPTDSRRKQVDAAISGHILGQTSFTCRYSREPVGNQ